MDFDLPKTSWKRATPFRLGDVEVHPDSGELRGRRGVERLRPLVMDLLLRLVAEPGAVVRRETLLEEVWPRRMVNDEVLSRAVAELRAALGDDVKNARYVETLPKIGYRLVAPIAELPSATGDAPVAPAPSVPPLPAPASRPRRPARWTLVAAVAAACALLGGLSWLATRQDSRALALERRLHAARTFTSDPGRELGPRFSPDGQRVAYSVADAEGAARIEVRHVDGRVIATIGGGDTVVRLNPVFFPGGRRLAYWRADNLSCAIAEWDLDAQRETRELVDCARRPRARFDLSRDGRWLVFAAPARPNFPAGLQLLDLQSGTVRPVTAPEPGFGDDAFPRFNATATRIAFFRGNESHRAVWIVEREGGAPERRLSTFEGPSYGAAWLGAEGPLLVSADWFGSRALNVLDTATGQARLAGARGARFPDTTPEGAIVFENAMYAANLWRLPLRPGAAPAELWPSTRYSNQPELSPDGKRVVFASNRDGTDGLYVGALEGTPQRIAGAEAYRFLRPHWAADGRAVHAIRISIDAGGRPVQEAVRIAADGSALEVLTELGTAVNDVRETHDGRWMLWAETSGTALRLMRAPVGRLRAGERLPWPLVSHYQAQGDRVALTQPQLTPLMLCRLSTLACELSDVTVDAASVYHWTLGNRSIFLRGIDGRVARYDIESRRVVAAYPAEPSGGGTSLAVSADEGELVFIKEEGPAIDLMIVTPQ